MTPTPPIFNPNATWQQTVTAPTPVPPTPTTINSTTITPQTPIPYTTPNPTPVYPVGSLDPTVTPPITPTPGDNSATDLSTQLEQLNNSLEGKSADQTAAEAVVGLPKLQATQNDLSATLTGLQNEAAAIPLSLQNEATGRGITAEGLAPIQSAALRDNAVKALTVSTLLAASQGQIANAQALADKAVAQKYDPIQEKITAATANLNLILNSPNYSIEKKNQAQAQLDIQNKNQATLDKAKSDASAILKTAQDAAANGAKSDVLTQIAAAATPADALAIAAKNGAAANTNTQIANVGGRQLLIDSKTGATIKDLGPTTTSTSTGTAAERSANAVASAQSIIDSGTTLASGVPITDSDGNMTPEAWKALIAQAPSEGLSRSDFIKAFSNYITAGDGTVSTKYGLTPAELKLAGATARS